MMNTHPDEIMAPFLSLVLAPRCVRCKNNRNKEALFYGSHPAAEKAIGYGFPGYPGKGGEELLVDALKSYLTECIIK